MSRIPDFIIVGAAKSGTSSLSHYLDLHPDVAVVSNRLEYFGPYRNPAVGDLSEQAYLDYFKDVPGGVMAGEKSVSYLYAPTVPDEIHTLNPAMKIMMILRDPVTRAYSDYWHRRRTGGEDLPFEAALAAENERIAAGARFEMHYARYGFYADRVKAYFDRFGRENVCVFEYGELNRDPAVVCRQAFDFLGASREFEVTDFPVYNKGGTGKKNPVQQLLVSMAQDARTVGFVRAVVPGAVKDRVTGWMNVGYSTGAIPPLEPATGDRLRALYEEDFRRLESMLDWDLTSWRHG